MNDHSSAGDRSDSSDSSSDSIPVLLSQCIRPVTSTNTVVVLMWLYLNKYNRQSSISIQRFFWPILLVGGGTVRVVYRYKLYNGYERCSCVNWSDRILQRVKFSELQHFAFRRNDWNNRVWGSGPLQAKIFEVLQDQYTLGTALKHHFCEGFRARWAIYLKKIRLRQAILGFFLSKVFFFFTNLEEVRGGSCKSQTKKPPP